MHVSRLLLHYWETRAVTIARAIPGLTPVRTPNDIQRMGGIDDGADPLASGGEIGAGRGSARKKTRQNKHEKGDPMKKDGDANESGSGEGTHPQASAGHTGAGQEGY